MLRSEVLAPQYVWGDEVEQRKICHPPSLRSLRRSFDLYEPWRPAVPLWSHRPPRAHGEPRVDGTTVTESVRWFSSTQRNHISKRDETTEYEQPTDRMFELRHPTTRSRARNAFTSEPLCTIPTASVQITADQDIALAVPSIGTSVSPPGTYPLATKDDRKSDTMLTTKSSETRAPEEARE